jgi:uncharacterized membrane protein YeaQ/YmgE (transglycosylase-associated protein family)
MSVLGWIVLGLIAGFIGSKIVNREARAFCSTLCWVLSVQSSAVFCSAP